MHLATRLLTTVQKIGQACALPDPGEDPKSRTPNSALQYSLDSRTLSWVYLFGSFQGSGALVQPEVLGKL